MLLIHILLSASLGNSNSRKRKKNPYNYLLALIVNKTHKT